MSESDAPDMREIEEFSFDVDAITSSDVVVAEPALARDLRPDENEEFSSPILELLAKPVLPELKHAARARLMMQSPTRLYFYWSVETRSFEALKNALGGSASDYTLALRLLDLTHDIEEVQAVEPEGSWWFNVRPDTEYRAEIGFYSVSRPFVRILFSNTIATPRKGPSPHSASEARWAISKDKFVDVLNVSGFESDADRVEAGALEQNIASTVSSYLKVAESEITAFDAEELRWALAELAAGTPIEDLKYRVSAALFAFLEKHLAQLNASAIRDNIGIAATEFEDEFIATPVFGSSLVNFPRRRRFAPISSLNTP